ncbi:Outer membrane porin protein [compost metagenome]
MCLPATFGMLAGTAQANLTLYGTVDANIEYVNHLSSVLPTHGGFPGPGQDRVAVASGGLSGSRWGLLGTEDLGDGLRAVISLENGFGIDDARLAQSGRLFGRQAFVGLLDEHAGRLTFGRQYTAIFDTFSNFSPSGYSTQYEPVAAQLGLDYRSDNTVKYSGTVGGMTASANWSFGNGAFGAGEIAGQSHRDTGYGAGLSYFTSGFGLALAFNRYNPTLGASGTAGNFRKAGVAASYRAGPVKVMGGYRWGLNKSSGGASIVRDDYYWAGINYRATGNLDLSLAYYYDDVKVLAGRNVQNPWQFSLVADFSLSKRIDVYLTTAYAGHAGINFDTSAVSFANGYYLGSNHRSMTAVAVGVRHRF